MRSSAERLSPQSLLSIRSTPSWLQRPNGLSVEQHYLTKFTCIISITAVVVLILSGICLRDDNNRRIVEHPILGALGEREEVEITVDGRVVKALDGEPIAAALLAAGITTLRRTRKTGEPRGYFCGIGLCTDCMMVVDGRPNVRTCVTPVRKGMNVETQVGLGHG